MMTFEPHETSPAIKSLIFPRKTHAPLYRKKDAPLFLRGLDGKFEGATASIIEGIASSTEEPETSTRIKSGNRDYTVIVLALSETLKTTLHIVRGELLTLGAHAQEGYGTRFFVHFSDLVTLRSRRTARAQ